MFSIVFGLVLVLTTITIPHSIYERLRKRAFKAGVLVEELVLELLTRDIDPKDKAMDYVEAARGLLEQAREELEKGNIRQAAEKVWGAIALAIKAYAYYKEKRRLASHSELWEYKDTVAEELGGWVSDTFRQANSMHTCFYEGWCTEKDVKEVMVKVNELVNVIAEKIRQHITDRNNKRNI